MGYILYADMGKKEFEALKLRLKQIQLKIQPILDAHKFYLKDDVKNLDYLTLNYHYFENGIKGNIGLIYSEDDSYDGNRCFKLFAMKSFDISKGRYFKRLIETVHSIDDVELRCEYLFENAILKFNTADREDLTDFVPFQNL